MKIDTGQLDEPDLQIGPLIDMVFLLLIYFLTTASLARPEADLGIRLPGMVAQAQSVSMPDEQIVEVRSTGHVVLNGREFDRPDGQELPELVATLIRYRQASEASRNEALITITADDETRHQRMIDVMNACAAARITNVTFSMQGEE
jgi:biopolymer transport protein ExbD